MIDCVLSVYVRRGRLPEPGEILFVQQIRTWKKLSYCSVGSSVVRAMAALTQYSSCRCSHAQLHYAGCSSERPSGKNHEHGTASAADLLIVSGRPRQWSSTVCRPRMIVHPCLHPSCNVHAPRHPRPWRSKQSDLARMDKASLLGS